MNKRPDSPDPAQPPNFETSLRELEEAVEQLEAGELPLEESLQLFEKGVASLKACHTILDQAEKRIRILVKGAKGEPALQDAGTVETTDSGIALNTDPSASTVRKKPAKPAA